jgi:hypothetical protein
VSTTHQPGIRQVMAHVGETRDVMNLVEQHQRRIGPMPGMVRRRW